MVNYLYHYTGAAIAVAHGIKCDAGLRRAVAEEMAEKFDFRNSVIVPVPGRMGYAIDTLDIAVNIYRMTGSPVCDVLKGLERDSVYELKKRGVMVSPESLSIYPKGVIPLGRRIIVLDNVVDSGTTATAAISAIGGGEILAYALSRKNSVPDIQITGRRI